MYRYIQLLLLNALRHENVEFVKFIIHFNRVLCRRIGVRSVLFRFQSFSLANEFCRNILRIEKFVAFQRNCIASYSSDSHHLTLDYSHDDCTTVKKVHYVNISDTFKFVRLPFPIRSLRQNCMQSYIFCSSIADEFTFQMQSWKELPYPKANILITKFLVIRKSTWFREIVIFWLYIRIRWCTFESNSIFQEAWIKMSK